MQHQGCRWDFVSNNVEDQQVSNALPANAHLHDGAFWAFQHLHDIAVGDADACSIFAIDLDNAVPRSNPQFFRRPSADGGHDHDGVSEDVELDPNPFKVAIQGFIGLFQFVRREIDRMWVQSSSMFTMAFSVNASTSTLST